MKILVEIDEETYERCVAFAEARTGNSAELYAQRGEPRKQKVFQDIVVGAMGEFAAYNYLKARGLNPREPDLRIYKKQRRDFASDLDTEDGFFHVKTQSVESADKYGYSWLFQKHDKVLKDPKPGEYFIFAGVQDRTVELKGIVLAKDLVNLVKEPKVYRYKYTKYALYFDDIVDSGIKLWRF